MQTQPNRHLNKDSWLFEISAKASLWGVISSLTPIDPILWVLIPLTRESFMTYHSPIFNHSAWSQWSIIEITRQSYTFPKYISFYYNQIRLYYKLHHGPRNIFWIEEGAITKWMNLLLVTIEMGLFHTASLWTFITILWL